MSETEVRLATPEDYDQFMTLAAAYLVELRERGSEIRPTARSLQFYADLFHTFIIHRKLIEKDQAVRPPYAVVLMVEDYAFSAAMGVPHVFDTDFGYTAYGHGTYVHPDHRRKGLSVLLRDRMRAELRLRGFETIVGGVHLGNETAAASLKDSTFTWYQIVGYERLTNPTGQKEK